MMKEARVCRATLRGEPYRFDVTDTGVDVHDGVYCHPEHPEITTFLTAYIMYIVMLQVPELLRLRFL